eukprot:TRINITY_DN76_c0_g4_i1.p1 TRINITY_DN76_c0_g4~~TRINITY_DN76_c0_g4_i1.p1  ORF type:complete len:1254 (-),score=260.52 TRINITY_DN76_c0_g4_i1:588-4037(-)
MPNRFMKKLRPNSVYFQMQSGKLSGVNVNNLNEFKRRKECKGSDTAFIQFTSGSTSIPKGVKVTFDNIQVNAQLIYDNLKRPQNCSVLLFAPHFHDLCLITTLYAMVADYDIYFLTPMEFFRDPNCALKAISQHRIQFLTCVPGALEMMVNKRLSAENKDNDLDLSCIKEILVGAQMLFPSTLQRFISTFAPLGMDPGAMTSTYGMAEHTLMAVHVNGDIPVLEVDRHALEQDRVIKAISLSTSTNSFKNNSNNNNISHDKNNNTHSQKSESLELISVGIPKFGVKVKVVNPTTRTTLPDDHVGEIFIQSPSVTAGYFNDDKTTDDTYKCQIIEDGINLEGYWLKSGDLGFFHEEHLYVCGRIKEQIKLCGRHIFAEDIEESVRYSDALHIRPGGVTALSGSPLDQPNHVGIETITLAVEVRPTLDPSHFQRLCQRVRQTVTTHCDVFISTVILLKSGDTIKTTSGKLERLQMKELLRKGEIKPLFVDEVSELPIDLPTLMHESSSSEANDPTSVSIIPQTLNQPNAHVNSSNSIINNSRLLLLDSLERFLGLSNEDLLKEIDDGASIGELCHDSLVLLRIKSALETISKQTISISWMLDEELRTVINDLVENINDGRDNSIISTNDKETTILKERMFLEVRNLQEQLKKTKPIQPSIPISNSNSNDNRLAIVTGATGFVGLFLVHNLLTESSGFDWEVVCVIRAGSYKHVEARLFENMEHYGLSLSESQKSRLSCVNGDVEKPDFGLSLDYLTSLLSKFHNSNMTMDILPSISIFHCAAIDNFVHSYDMLRDCNIGGTANAIILAKKMNANLVHTSSCIVYLAETLKNCSVYASSGLFNGYCQTKYVAEKLVLSAASSIHMYSKGISNNQLFACRFGYLYDDTDASVDVTDSVENILQLFAETGLAPDFSDARVDLTPIEHAVNCMRFSVENCKNEKSVIRELPNEPENEDHISSTEWNNGFLTFYSTISLSKLISTMGNLLKKPLHICHFDQWLCHYQAERQQQQEQQQHFDDKDKDSIISKNSPSKSAILSDGVARLGPMISKNLISQLQIMFGTIPSDDTSQSSSKSTQIIHSHNHVAHSQNSHQYVNLTHPPTMSSHEMQEFVRFVLLDMCPHLMKFELTNKNLSIIIFFFIILLWSLINLYFS